MNTLKRERRGLSLALALVLILSSFAPGSADAAAIKAGAKCGKLNVTRVVGTLQYTCIKQSKKLVWSKPKRLPTKPASTSQPKPVPAPTQVELTVYSGGPGKTASSRVTITPEHSTPDEVRSSTANLKLFVHNPGQPFVALSSNFIWLKAEGGDWKGHYGSPAGYFLLNLAPGTYDIDTVEPHGKQSEYLRKRYTVNVNAIGVATIKGVTPNSSNVFGLTINLADPAPPVTQFVPSNICQLQGQDGNLNMNQGFPSRPLRLTTSGTVRAIIIPVDFPDVVAYDKPAEAFFDMATETGKYFNEMSGGRVKFEFQTLEKYLRMPFKSDEYRLGQWSGGSPDAYYEAAIAEADPLVDFSRFDVVYVLSPKNIPWSSIAYGPAFPRTIKTEDGSIHNGSISGADAYQNFPGAGWKWMAHETGHLFGLHDLYTVDPQPGTFGEWDLMSLNWTNRAPELNAWNRFILDWLPFDQVHCFDATSGFAGQQTFELSPLPIQNAGKRAVFLKLSNTKILVMEYRATAGRDVIPTSDSGLLVYQVDMTIPSIRGGWTTVRPAGSSAPDFTDAAIGQGERVSVSGIDIQVISVSANQIRFTVD